MPVLTFALVAIDARMILLSLEISAAIVGGMMLLLGLILPMRLHTVWKRTRIIRLSMPCEDPQSIRFRLAETLKQYGYKPAGAANGPFSLEAPSWRKKMGAANVSVDFPEPRVAVITGQAIFVSRCAHNVRGVRELPVEGSLSYWPWLKVKTKPFVWLALGLFIFFFCFILWGKSQGLA